MQTNLEHSQNIEIIKPQTNRLPKEKPSHQTSPKRTIKIYINQLGEYV